MSTTSSDPSPPSIDPHPPSPPPPKPSTSPPMADTVIRPFTSQGSSFPSTSQPLRHSSEHPSTTHDSSIEPPQADVGPYTSASARTSYTRVDVDSLPPPVYPPLPPFPAVFAVQDTPALAAPAADNGATTHPTSTVAPTPDGPVQTLATEPVIPQTPQISLTFLLVSGRRKTQSFEPETTVGRVKELIWNAWPARDADWQDERPPTPSYLRILYLGKILQDDDTLLRVGFPTSLPSQSNTASPTIVHLSIRPYGLPSDDPALSKKRRLSIAIGRRLSAAGGVGVGVTGGGGGRDGQHDDDAETRRAGCCAGCTIC